MATRVTLSRGKSGWILLSVSPEKIYRSPGYLDVILSEDQERIVNSRDQQSVSVH